MSQVSATAESEMSQSQGRLMTQVSATAESEMSQSQGQLMSQSSATASVNKNWKGETEQHLMTWTLTACVKCALWLCQGGGKLSVPKTAG